MTAKVNPNPCKNPPNTVPYIPADPDSDPSFSDYSLSESSESSDNEYYKWIRGAKKDKNKLWSKTRSDDPIKKCVNITAKILIAAYKSNFVKDEDSLQCRVYFLFFMNSLKIVLSPFSETYMLLMDYPSIRGEELPYHAKNATWKFCMHIYMCK